MKIRIKLLLPSIVSLLLFMLVLNLYWLPNYLDVQREKYRHYYQHEIHVLGMALRRPLQYGNLKQVRRLLDRVLQKKRSWKSLVLQDRDGRRIYPRRPVRVPRTGDTIRVLSRVEHRGKPLARMLLVADLKQLLARDAGYIKGLNDILWAVLLLAVISTVVMQERIVVRPIRRLLASAKQVAGGDFNSRFDCHRRDEVGILTGSFRDLAKDLEQALLVFRLEAEKERAIGAELQQKNRFIEAVNRLQQVVIAGQDAPGVYDEILHQCLCLTETRFGLVAEVGLKDSGLPLLHVMSRACSHREPGDKHRREHEIACRRLQRLAESVMHSAVPQFLLDGQGLGMVAIPLFGNEQMVGVLCLGGRPGGYRRAFVAGFQVLFQTIGSLMETEINRRERRQVQQALQKNEQELRLIVDNVVDGIVSVDAGGTIQSVNPAAEKLFGYPAAQMLGRNVGMLMPDQYRVGHDQLMSDYFSDGQKRILDIEREVTGRRRDGTQFSMSLAVRQAGADEQTLFVAIVRDITERKQYEQRIARERDRVQYYLEVVEVILIALDEHGTIEMMNRKGCEILGYRQGEAVGRNFFSTLFLPEVVDEIQADYRAAMANQSDFLHCIECRVRTRSGELRTVSWRNRVFYDADRRGAGMIVSGEDVTELREAESERRQLRHQLHQAQKMDAIGKLTGGIAHDFNNMLASVLGYSELALEVLDEADPQRLKKYLGEIHAAGERARDLVSKMLTFSRGAESPKPVPVALAPLIDDVVSMLRAVIPASIEIVTEAHDNMPLVLMDTIELQQVVMNLCINARDAMQGSGRLEIGLVYQAGLDAVCTSCHQPVQGDFVVLSVKDSGSGIDAGDLDNLFSPFFSTKDVGKGTGMGLSVVHGIVHARRGHILVDSRLGQGADFRMLFRPAAQAAPVHVHPAAMDKSGGEAGGALPQPAPNGGHGERARLAGAAASIMVVDDEQAVGKFLADYLRAQGYQVEQYTSALDALQAYGDHPDRFELVLSDYAMPDLNGLEFYQSLRALDQAVQLVMCTGYSEKFDQLAARKAGLAGYLPKPVDTQVLLELVENLIPDDGQPGRTTAGAGNRQ